jgi:hypothetical protein
MKIQLELSKFQIHFISMQMELFETGLAQMNFVIQPRDKKLILSICSDISDKFHNKSRAILKELKPKKKPYRITLKWYQVYALNILIFAATLHSNDREDIAICKSLQMIMDQKLA